MGKGGKFIMMKHIKKLLATTIVATTLLGSTITACAYDLPKPNTTQPPTKIINNISLIATSVDYETSKYPQIDMKDYPLYSDWLYTTLKKRLRLTLNYTDIQGNLYSSGNILLGVKLSEYEIKDNDMACLKINGIDIKNSYVATYDVGVKKVYNTRYEYNSIVRLAPSYSVFGNDVEIKLYHTYSNHTDRYEITGEFKVADALLMDGFEVVIDAAPNVKRSVSGRNSGIRTSKFVGEADVLSYTGANPLSDEDMASEGRILFAYSDEPFTKSQLDYEFDVYFNDIKVADNVKMVDIINDIINS